MSFFQSIVEAGVASTQKELAARATASKFQDVIQELAPILADALVKLPDAGRTKVGIEGTVKQAALEYSKKECLAAPGRGEEVVNMFAEILARAVYNSFSSSARR
ncbi:hypothetical protein DFP72DRAFT_1073405 [Ephemerocybe angulata]|uniref:Uncharacterized protein n=1 Tax=Ephemerocybe angulata TaxID=980116 RepID=A0A8H6LYZ7_9AGAR|nr:hypothetical protein DFP72DRAFT_1073405 [Tulosesus angulatus]